MSVSQIWYFTVRPSDGTDSGELQTSGSVTISNTIPAASDPSITPASPKTGDDLVGSYNYSDADDDIESGSEIRWYKDNVLQTDYNNILTVPSSVISVGQIWYFTVRPSDGTDFGELQTSGSVTISSAAPVASSLSITPASPRTGDDLVGSYNYSDVDDDIESGSEIRWYNDNVLQIDYNDTLTMPWSATAKGEIWHFTVRPCDGTEYGALETSPAVTIQNTPPLAEVGGPYEGVVGTALSFASTGSSDADNDALTHVWDFDHRNGTDDADSTEPNPTHTYAEPGVYTVTLMVNDGTVDSAPVTTIADIKVAINGFVELQGYGNGPTNVNISIRLAGTTTDLETFDVVTYDGHFTILSSMELGTYDLIAKSGKYLKAIARDVSISGDSEDVVFDPEIPNVPAGELRGGDCNDDNAITLEDFSLLAYYYNETSDYADINGDGQVDILDFIILSSNFGFIGVDGRTLASPEASPAFDNGSNRNLRFYIHMDKDIQMISQGDEFNVHIGIDDAYRLKGYSIMLQYDHRALQIVESDGGLVKEGAFLKSNPGNRATLLISDIYKCRVADYEEKEGIRDDRTMGRMMLSDYIIGDGSGVSGSGTIATLKFRLMESTGEALAISIYEPVVADDQGKINTLPRKEFALQILPRRTSLLKNYPNPLNPETWIPYELAEASDVRIGIYSLTGRLIRMLDLGYRQPGFYARRENAAHWDGRNQVGEEVASGVYFYTIRAGDFSATRKMTVVR